MANEPVSKTEKAQLLLQVKIAADNIHDSATAQYMRGPFNVEDAKISRDADEIARKFEKITKF